MIFTRNRDKNWVLGKSDQQYALSDMVFRGPVWQNNVGVRAVLVLRMEWMWSRLATTRLIVADSFKIHVAVGVLSLPVIGTHPADALHTSGKVASWRTRAASLRSKLVMPLVGYQKLIRLSWMSFGHSKRHTKLVPS